MLVVELVLYWRSIKLCARVVDGILTNITRRKYHNYVKMMSRRDWLKEL